MDHLLYMRTECDWERVQKCNIIMSGNELETANGVPLDNEGVIENSVS